MPLLLLPRNQASFQPSVSTAGGPQLVKFWTPPYSRFAFNSADIEPPVVETNVHFIGRFTPTKLFAQFAFNTWDIQPPVTGDINTHFVGKFKPAPRMSWPSGLYQSVAADLSFVPTLQKLEWIIRARRRGRR